MSVYMLASSRGAAAAAVVALRCEGFDAHSTHRGATRELLEVDCADEEASVVRQRIRLYDPEAQAVG